MLTLRVEVTGQKPQHHHLPAQYSGLIGRHPRCDLVINNPSVSGKHAQIEVHDGKVTVHDLGSTNGTWYHHQKVIETQLLVGEKIRFGGQDVWLLEIIDAPSAGIHVQAEPKTAYLSHPKASALVGTPHASLSPGSVTELTNPSSKRLKRSAGSSSQAALSRLKGFAHSMMPPWLEPENPNPLFDPLKAVTAFAALPETTVKTPLVVLQPRLSMLQAATSVKEIPLKGPKIVLGKPTGAQLIFTEEKTPFYHWKIHLIQAESPLFINQQPCFPAESVLRHLDIVVYRDTAFQYLEHP